jgi:ParB family chromosome partitioning protein
LLAKVEASTSEAQAGSEEDGATLPEFLAGDSEETAGEDEERQLVAAE